MSLRAWASALATAAALSLASLAPQLGSSTDVVRLRNALLAEPARSSADFDWTPATRPADFPVETRRDVRFDAAAARLGLSEQPDDWARAVAIARHLLTAHPVKRGGAIQSDLYTTYQRITQDGDGYCADFVRTFNALALSAGIPVRSWAFSFDGFGGHGHVMPEIWNRQLGRWQVLDPFNNIAFVDASGLPISALELRAGLTSTPSPLSMEVLVAGAPQEYPDRSKAWAYYRAGSPQWYLWWGERPFTYDAATSVRLFDGRVRALAQIGAMVEGVHPAMRVAVDDGNRSAWESIRFLRAQLLAVGTVVFAALVGLVALALRAARRAAAPGALARPADAVPGPEAAAAVVDDVQWPAVCLVGPLPPPSGGMANQCEQLLRLLRAEHIHVQHVQTNAPYRPAWVGGVPVLRAVARFVPYQLRLWRAIGASDVVHVMANSGWAWYLFAAPALFIARMRGVGAIVNYRGGEAEAFFERSRGPVLRQLRRARLLVVPSAFLQRVFEQQHLAVRVIPNIIDLSRFEPVERRAFGRAPHLLVARNLEPIYDVATAIRTFARVRERYPLARLTVAGTGPDAPRLRELVASLGLGEAVDFPGRIDNARMPLLYRQADCALNTSTVDNMPISVLEALASGVPMVSTAAGGIPDLVQDGVSALLAPIGDDEALAAAVAKVLDEPDVARRLAAAGLQAARAFAWAQIRPLWRQAYADAAVHVR